MTRKKYVLALAAIVGMGACDSSGTADIVARVADHELTIQQTVDLLAGNEELPAQVDVVNAIAELWVDYVAVALEAQQDTSFNRMDLTTVMQPQFDQEVLTLLRDTRVQVDTILSEEELRSLWEDDPPGGSVQARHILVDFPPTASPAQRDSVFLFVEGLKARVLSGEDFGRLAEEYSVDTGSGAQGGDLGSFQRGQMVRPFEDAAFALQPGELSDPVETPFGVHLIQVTGRENPSYADTRETFRVQVLTEKFRVADSLFVLEVDESALIEVDEEAADAAKAFAEDTNLKLNRRASRRVFAEYEGGTVTAEDLRVYMVGRTEQFKRQVAEATTEQLLELVRGLARTEYLLLGAAEEGIEVPAARQDSLTAVTRARLIELSDMLGLRHIQAQDSETPDEAIDRVALTIIGDMLANRRNVITLDAVTGGLREEFAAVIVDRALPEVVSRVGDLRGGAGAVPLVTTPAPETEVPPTPDSAGAPG